MIIRLLLGAIALLAIESRAVAQPPPATVPPRSAAQQVQQARQQDTSAVRDSLRRAQDLITWAEPDSVLTALMSRSGRTFIRFQGDTMAIDARTKELRLVGKPSGIMQDSVLLVGDTITYNDSTQIVVVESELIVLRDPARNRAADVVAHTRLTYEIALGRARVMQVSTASDEAGELWLLQADRAALIVGGEENERNRFYGHGGTITSCTDPRPHYHIRARDVKMISEKIMVLSGAVFYVSDVPVFILPWLFSDLRPGRRSGLLSPRFGVTDIVRNGPGYKRNIENVGYYFAISDYLDATSWFDWRSGASAREGDPGFLRFTGLVNYNVLSRFMSGSLSLGHSRQADGLTNTSVSLSHKQSFSLSRQVSADLNYVTSTRVQQRQELLAFREQATIRSRLNYSQSMGPFSLSAGGTRTQYPGQELVDQTFPTISLSSKTIELLPGVTVTPNMSFNNTQRMNFERAGPLSQRFIFLPGGGIDSVNVSGNSRNSSLRVDMPLQLGRVRITNGVQFTDAEDNFPQIFTVRDVNDTSLVSTRIYPRTFRTDADWSFNVALPATFFQGGWNLTPSVSFSNIHPGPLWVRSERSGGQFVSQGKRPTYGLSIAPTFYGLFGGFGALSRIRHAVRTSISYGYSPPASVSDAYLAAIGQTRPGYLGALAQSAISLSMNHVIEAKLRGDTLAAGGGRKIRLLSVDFSSLTWDFEKAKATGGTGLASDRFGINTRSDLLPGFDLSANYSLFQGSILTDTAVFKPFLTELRMSFSVSRSNNPFRPLLRLFGIGSTEAAVEVPAERAEEELRTTLGTVASATGATSRDAAFLTGTPREFSLRLDFSMTRQRPPKGDVLLVEHDARTVCAARGVSPFLLDQCIREFEALALADPNSELRPPGGAFIRQPARTTLAGTLATPLTRDWSISWGTSYDFEVGDFSNHLINLKRDFHDWDANFSFSQGSLGSFSFLFFIALKAEPDLKFEYTQRSYGRGR